MSTQTTPTTPDAQQPKEKRLKVMIVDSPYVVKDSEGKYHIKPRRLYDNKTTFEKE